jgi:hypothetical protein
MYPWLLDAEIRFQIYCSVLKWERETGWGVFKKVTKVTSKIFTVYYNFVNLSRPAARCFKKLGR